MKLTLQMKDYRQFLFEAESPVKMDNPIQYKDNVLQILKQHSTGLYASKDEDMQELTKRIYDKYCIIVPLNDEGDDYKTHRVLKENPNRRNKIDFSRPIMNQTRVDNFISDDERFKNALVVNQIADFKLADSKKLFTETFNVSINGAG